MKMSRFFGFALAFFAGVLTLFVSFGTVAVPSPAVLSTVMTQYMAETGAQNAVAAIYLNYRMYDTIFEALMLLVSVMGVIHFSRHDHDHFKFLEVPQVKKTTTASAIALIIPVIMMLAVYIILNGHNTPGGGFQGGAALSSVFICVYLIRPGKNIHFYALERLEKLLFLTLAIIAIVFVLSNLYLSHTAYNVPYMILMNSLIGVKVFCGLTIVFYRFVHYEDT